MSERDEQSFTFLNSDAVNDDFFIEIVESALKIPRDKFALKLALVSPAIGKNNNFVSVVFRAKIKIQLHETGESRRLDVIIKALLSTLKEFKEFSVFPRERFMYEDIVGSFERIWLEGAGSEIQFGPKSIKFETDPYEIIVLQDLKASQYEMLDKNVGLTMPQAKMLLAKLAKFHAASAVRYQKDGVIQTYLDRKASMPAMDIDSPMAASFLNLHTEFVKALRSFGDCDIYADKIARWSREKILSSFIDVAEPMRCGFKVLNHGDIWINNMMFKSDDKGEPVDVIMFDYQGSFWASPATDLLYFLISSVRDEVKVEHFDDFIEFYRNELSEALVKVGYGLHIPTLPELFIDIMEKGHMASLSIMFILLVVKYDSPEEMSVQDLMGMSGNADEAELEKLYNRVYGNETFKKAIKVWLPFLNKRGFLDTLLPNEE